ncbi:sugar transferase [Crystallibacter degradans]|uniref:sugar transferase n=1 Tax=Crystallibacter degradans TaxID=2726743 RepID=UPI001475A871|nr:sugar transferase [Arthrobacter sp. SF27]NMR28223.1 sugar transferase [Arthrobacter sp. SF27]
MSGLKVNAALDGESLSLASALRRRQARRNSIEKSGRQWCRTYQSHLHASDSLVITAAVGVSGMVLYGLEPAPTQVTWLLYVSTSSFIAGAWLAMLELFRTRDRSLIGVGASEYKQVLRATLATFGLLAAAFVLLNTVHFRGFFLLDLPIGVSLLLFTRWLWRRHLNKHRAFGRYLSDVLVLGRSKDVKYVATQIEKYTGATYQVVGAVLEETDLDSVIVCGRNIRNVGNLDDVESAIASSGADAVIVAGDIRGGGVYIRDLGWQLERSSTEIVLASSLTNVAGPRIRIRPVEGLPLMHVELPYFEGGKHVIKRAMDIVISAVALLILAPLLVALAIVVKLDSDGPALYRQDRVGRRGKLFRMYKFRSMVQTAEQELAQLRDHNDGNGLLFKIRDDPRVTGPGKWLRKYSLDELPQFYNVLRGEMSLVGPRPPLPSEACNYQGHVHRRLFIKPGLTGLWQINGRSDLDWEEAVRLDLYYVENWSVTGDLMIMWRTFNVMLKPVGAY